MCSRRHSPNGASILEEFSQAHQIVRLNTKLKARDVAVNDLVADLSDGVRTSSVVATNH